MWVTTTRIIKARVKILGNLYKLRVRFRKKFQRFGKVVGNFPANLIFEKFALLVKRNWVLNLAKGFLSPLWHSSMSLELVRKRITYVEGFENIKVNVQEEVS